MFLLGLILGALITLFVMACMKTAGIEAEYEEIEEEPFNVEVDYNFMRRNSIHVVR